MRRTSLAAAFAAALVMMGLGPLPGAGQDAPRVSVRIRQIAGSTLYLDVGTRHGLASGDTLRVAREPEPAKVVGRLVVTAATETRSVLTYVGDPFPVTRGEVVVLFLLREPEERPAEAVPAGPDSGAAPRPVPSEPAVLPVPPTRSTFAPQRAHGRIGMDVSAHRSVTTLGSSTPTDVERTFATPAFRMDVRAPGLVGGFTFHTSARVAYRYNSGSTLQPSTSTRVYAASLERRFTEVPLRVILGRFNSPAESYSGFWDGAFVQVGEDGFGAGAIVGFEPDQWNEKPSTQRPKATVFVQGRARGEGWRWRGDASAHTVRPTDSVPAHTFLGLSQRASLGVLSLSQDLQVDRDPQGGPWRVSRLRVRAALEVAPGVEVRGGASRRESYFMDRFDSPFSPRRERLDAGIAVRGEGGYASVDLDVGRDAAGETTHGATAFFTAYRVPGLPLAGLSGSASRWSGSYGSTLALAPAFTVDLGTTALRFGYRYSRSDYLARRVVTHGADAALNGPLGPGLRISVRGRLQWGGYLRSQGVDVSLSRIF